MTAPHPRRPFAAFASSSAAGPLALLALWLVATLGWRPLLLPDEGRYAEVARAMVEMPGASPWVPTLNGLPFFHKPPLFYLLDGLAMRAVGVGDASARFGSAVGAWAMGAALFLAMRRWHGPRAAGIGLVVLTTTPFFFLAGQYANHDMLVGGLIAVAVLAFARAVDAPGTAATMSRRWVVAGWIASALALLAKGLIGLVLPALVVVPWLVAQRRARRLAGLLDPVGLVAFAIVGLPWFVAMQLRHPDFFDYFIVEQHFRRFAGTATFNNVHGPWFFLVLLPLATLPWSAWLPTLGRAWRHDAASAAAGRPSMPALYAWWVVAIVGFFSIPGSKLAGYVLPALAPWCALLALAVAGTSRIGRARSVAVAAALLLLGAVAAVGTGAVATPHSNRGLGLALGRAIGAGDRVVMVDAYFYDVPFYARLARPVVIAGDWADPEIARHDNWRKEIAEAARFDPARAAELLRPLGELDRLACGVPVAWFVAPPERAARVAALPGAARVVAGREAELWRVPGRPAC